MTQEIKTRIVLRNDTAANWVDVNPELLEGEMGVETDTGLFKFGKVKEVVDGVTTYYNWNDLEYANDIPEIDLSTVTNEVQVVDGTVDDLANGKVVGDMAIVRSTINGDLKSHTAYVWTKTGEEEVDGQMVPQYNWAAMDGNYSATNVFISEDITLSGDYGKDSANHTITTFGNKKIGDTFAAGTSMQEMWSEILSKRLQPTKSNPSISISASGDDGGKETGDTYTKPKATLTVKTGSYTYGYKDANGDKKSGTGVTFTSAKIAFGGDDTIETEGQYNTASNLGNDGTVSIEASSYAKDATTANYTDSSVSYTFSGNAAHTAGAIAIDNLGGASNPTVQIAANNKITATDKTVSFRGYRRMFVGCTTEALTSSVIRGLNLKNEKASTTAFTVTAPINATKLVIAAPTKSVGYNYTLSKAEMMTMGWEDYTTEFKSQTSVQVADKRGGDNGLLAYNIYVYEFAPLKAATDFRITLKSAAV